MQTRAQVRVLRQSSWEEWRDRREAVVRSIGPSVVVPEQIQGGRFGFPCCDGDQSGGSARTAFPVHPLLRPPSAAPDCVTPSSGESASTLMHKSDIESLEEHAFTHHRDGLRVHLHVHAMVKYCSLSPRKFLIK